MFPHNMSSMRRDGMMYGRSESWRGDRYERPHNHGYGDPRRSLPEIEFWVPMCCSKCEEKVQEELLELDGVYQIFCDQGSERVTVRGYVDPFEALKKVKRVKRKSEFWKGGISRFSTKLAHSTSFRSDYMRPRQLEESFYRSSPSRASFYRQQPSHSETYFFDNPYYESPRAPYVRPLSPDSFGWPTFQYDRVPPYAQTYYTEDYPHSYTWY